MGLNLPVSGDMTGQFPTTASLINIPAGPASIPIQPWGTVMPEWNFCQLFVTQSSERTSDNYSLCEKEVQMKLGSFIQGWKTAGCPLSSSLSKPKAAMLFSFLELTIDLNPESIYLLPLFAWEIQKCNNLHCKQAFQSLENTSCLVPIALDSSL